MVLFKKLSEVSEEQINNAVANTEPESKYLKFKRDNVEYFLMYRQGSYGGVVLDKRPIFKPAFYEKVLNGFKKKGVHILSYLQDRHFTNIKNLSDILLAHEDYLKYVAECEQEKGYGKKKSYELTIQNHANLNIRINKIRMEKELVFKKALSKRMRAMEINKQNTSNIVSILERL